MQIRNRKVNPLRPDTVVRSYRRLMRRYVGMVEAELLLLYSKTIRQDDTADIQQQEGKEAEIAAIIALLLLWWQNQSRALGEEIRAMFRKLNIHNDEQFVKMIKKISGLTILRSPYAGGTPGQQMSNPYEIQQILGDNVDYYRQERYLPTIQTTWQNKQLTYIDDSIRKLIGDYGGVLRDGLLTMAGAKAIKSTIERVSVATASRMEREGEEQIILLDAVLDKSRQQSFGGKSYEWVTKRDKLVRGTPGGKYPKAKPSHYARDTQIFQWNNPPSDGHPGEPYGCRCKAVMRL